MRYRSYFHAPADEAILKSTFNVDGLSLDLLDRMRPGHPMAMLVDLTTHTIYLRPCFNQGDGLLREDNQGGQFLVEYNFYLLGTLPTEQIRHGNQYEKSYLFIDGDQEPGIYYVCGGKAKKLKIDQSERAHYQRIITEVRLLDNLTEEQAFQSKLTSEQYQHLWKIIEFNRGHAQQQFIESIDRLGMRGGSTHTKMKEMVLNLETTTIDGQALGLGVWLGGCSVKVLPEYAMPNDASSVPMEFCLVRDKQAPNGWQLVYFNESRKRIAIAIDVIPELKEILKKTPANLILDVRSDERRQIEKILVMIYADFLVKDYLAENEITDPFFKFKFAKHRSTSQNRSAIKYTKLFREWFKLMNREMAETVHSENLLRELPLPIFSHIINVTCDAARLKRLNFANILLEKSFQDGDNGFSSHLRFQYTWMNEQPKDLIQYFFEEVMNVSNGLDILKSILNDREDLKRFNLYKMRQLPTAHALKNDNQYENSYIFIQDLANFSVKLYFLKQGEAVLLPILEKNKLSQLLNNIAENAVVPFQWHYEYEQLVPELWRIIGASNKDHEHFVRKDEHYLYLRESFPPKDLGSHGKYNNSFIFVKGNDDYPTQVYYVMHTRYHELYIDDKNIAKLNQLLELVVHGNGAINQSASFHKKLNDEQLSNLYELVSANQLDYYPVKYYLSPLMKLKLAIHDLDVALIERLLSDDVDLLSSYVNSSHCFDQIVWLIQCYETTQASGYSLTIEALLDNATTPLLLVTLMEMASRKINGLTEHKNRRYLMDELVNDTQGRNTIDKDGNSALYLTIKYQDYHLFEQLLSEGFTPKGNAIYEACMHGDKMIVLSLFQAMNHDRSIDCADSVSFDFQKAIDVAANLDILKLICTHCRKNKSLEAINRLNGYRIAYEEVVKFILSHEQYVQALTAFIVRVFWPGFFNKDAFQALTNYFNSDNFFGLDDIKAVYEAFEREAGVFDKNRRRKRYLVSMVDVLRSVDLQYLPLIEMMFRQTDHGLTILAWLNQIVDLEELTISPLWADVFRNRVAADSVWIILENLKKFYYSTSDKKMMAQSIDILISRLMSAGNSVCQEIMQGMGKLADNSVPLRIAMGLIQSIEHFSEQAVSDFKRRVNNLLLLAQHDLLWLIKKETYLNVTLDSSLCAWLCSLTENEIEGGVANEISELFFQNKLDTQHVKALVVTTKINALVADLQKQIDSPDCAQLAKVLNRRDMTGLAKLAEIRQLMNQRLTKISFLNNPDSRLMALYQVMQSANLDDMMQRLSFTSQNTRMALI